MNDLCADKEQGEGRTHAFLKALFPNLEALFIELRLLPQSGLPVSSFHSSLNSAEKAVRRALTDSPQPDIYFAACPRSFQSGTKKAVSQVNCLWVDLDAKDFDGGKTDAKKVLDQFPIQPNAIVDSGNGYYAYWLLKGPEPISNTDDITQIEFLLRSLAQVLGADSSTAELARILRIPGTLNLKDRQKPKPVRLLELHTERQYSFCDFEKRIRTEDLRAPSTAKGSNWISKVLEGLMEGNRNVSFAKIIGRLHQDCHDADTIFTILKPHAIQAGFGLSELRAEIEGICRRYPAGRKNRRTRGNAPPNSRAKVVCLQDVDPEDVEWLWPPYVPVGKLTFLDGDPGIGKTTIAIRMAASLSGGVPLPGQDGKLSCKHDGAFLLECRNGK